MLGGEWVVGAGGKLAVGQQGGSRCSHEELGGGRERNRCFRLHVEVELTGLMD